MGLDMYLASRRKVEGRTLQDIIAIDNELYKINDNIQERINVDENFNRRQQLIKENPDIAHDYGWSIHCEEEHYWRKANQVFAWFETNVCNGECVNCKSYEVEREDIEALVRTCNIVLENKALAQTLLPTSNGFFFGGSEYDDFYFSQVKNTAEVLSRLLTDFDFDNFILSYHAWW